MNDQSIQFRKSHHNNLPTMWDGKATWCVSMGPVGAGKNGAAICCLWFFPPNVPQQPGILFNVNAPNQDTVKNVLLQLGRARHAMEAMIALGKLEDLGIVSDRVMQIA